MKFALAVFLAVPLFAQSVAITSRGVVVAHDGVVELYALNDSARAGEGAGAPLRAVWRGDGVSYPGVIATDDARAAILNPIDNRVRVVDLDTGSGTSFPTSETPIAAAFVDHQLYVLARDGRVIERIGAQSARVSVGQGPLPFVVVENKIYVYSRIDGLLQEITTSPFAVTRQLHTTPLASAFETDGVAGYLVYPQGPAMRVIDIKEMSSPGEMKVGMAPVDIRLTGNSTPLHPRMLAIADPFAKRVINVDAQQSILQAFARGFLQGLFGLGRSRGHEIRYATGVDRIITNGTQWMGFDSLNGALYAFPKPKPVAKDLGPNAFALGDGILYFWQNGTLVAQKTDR